MKPDLAIFHENSIPGDLFEEFRSVTETREKNIQIVSIEPLGPMAAIEWLMPTFIIGFIASSYFGGFLQEMGKEHYLLVKQQFKKLYPKVAGPDAPEVKLIGTQGKIRTDQPYSLYFSLIGEGPNSVQIKLLLKREVSQIEYENTIDKFLDLLSNLNCGSIDENTAQRFNGVLRAGRTILVVYDESTNSIVPIDPRTGELIR
jgi:hypothetical protein